MIYVYIDIWWAGQAAAQIPPQKGRLDGPSYIFITNNASVNSLTVREACPNTNVNSKPALRGTGRNGSRCSRPLSGAEVCVVGLLIQTRSPHFQQALRPGCNPTPQRQNPHWLVAAKPARPE